MSHTVDRNWFLKYPSKSKYYDKKKYNNHIISDIYYSVYLNSVNNPIEPYIYYGFTEYINQDLVPEPKNCEKITTYLYSNQKIYVEFYPCIMKWIIYDKDDNLKYIIYKKNEKDIIIYYIEKNKMISFYETYNKNNSKQLIFNNNGEILDIIIKGQLDYKLFEKKGDFINNIINDDLLFDY